jgi:hypothetical protein
MGAVDKADIINSFVECTQKTTKWYKKITFKGIFKIQQANTSDAISMVLQSQYNNVPSYISTIEYNTTIKVMK